MNFLFREGNRVKTREQGKILAFEGIKGLGALAIVIYHFGHLSTLLEGHAYPFNDIYIYIYIYMDILLLNCFLFYLVM